jgi:shikimate kinase / 3-dehydroquinate synthase
MSTPPPTRLYLLGLPGSGKTTAARLVADLLGWNAVDTDDLVVQRAGRSVAAIFADDGEPAFRELESEVLAEAARMERTVIATGGGIVGRAANRGLMAETGWRVTLDVAPAVALARLTHAELNGDLSERPLLSGDDPLLRLHALRQVRQPQYAEADDVIDTNDRISADVAARVVAGLVGRGLLAGEGATSFTRHVRTSGGEYEAVVAWGGLIGLGQRLVGLDLPLRAHVVTDSNLAWLYADTLMPQLVAAGLDADLWVAVPGERSKSAEELARLYDWLAERRAERGEPIIALGGGVIGDLAGYAAATYLRGLPLIQVPTSLLAQVDASIGGKVGIDHPRGKNLIGAFHQPRLVLADPATLLTLPPRARREGWAEVVKHGVALDADYFASLERDVDLLAALDPAATTRAVAESVHLKASVVERDEREGDRGVRQFLNYGHTVGHALEVVAGYGSWLHGEAVAVGMAAAVRIGVKLGVTPPEVVDRQDALLARFDLPLRCPGISVDVLLRATLWDKKVRGGAVRWIVPTAIGAVTVVRDVPEEVVRAALLEVGAEATMPVGEEG